MVTTTKAFPTGIRIPFMGVLIGLASLALRLQVIVCKARHSSKGSGCGRVIIPSFRLQDACVGIAGKVFGIPRDGALARMQRECVLEPGRSNHLSH